MCGTASCCHGFTLLELVIVLLITAVLTAVALPKWAGALQSFRASTAASRIAADSAIAQSAAYSSSTSKTVSFSVGDSQYTLDGVAPLKRATGLYSVSLTEQSRTAVPWCRCGAKRGRSRSLSMGTVNQTAVARLSYKPAATKNPS